MPLRARGRLLAGRDTQGGQRQAAELGQRKAAAIRATGARLVVSANPGCSLQIAAALAADGGDRLLAAHIAEVLDASFRGLPLSALGVGAA